MDSFCRFHPSLEGRVHGRVFNDFELRLAYQGALAVVVPSRFEGFGLPVIEALAANSVVITTDVPGLREAASGAVPTVGSGDPQALADWLSLLLDPSSLAWLRRHLERRRRRRMSQLHPDLLGLSLLSKARRLASSLSR
ncbi:hypothetical protein KR100_01570 [Synechococcus sp. KORDI-100]|nr:hypothetical protein KR100_01570 [Synechococcus sp. KORDI-100]